MVATPLAHQAIGPIREALQQLETALHPTRRFDPAVSTKQFTVGVRDYLEPALLPRLMARLERTAPQIPINLVRAERRELERELSSGILDVAVDILLPLPDNIRRQRVITERLAVVVRKSHPKIGRRIDLDTYLAQRHILVSTRRQGPSAEDFELGRLGLQRKVWLRCQHHIAACHVVRKTELLLTMPERYAQLVNRDFHNRVLPFPIKTLTFDSYLYWHISADSDPANAWLRQQIRQALSQVVGAERAGRS